MVYGRRSFALLIYLRILEITVVCLMVWAEISFRRWVPVGLFDFPGKAMGIALWANILSVSCLLIRWFISLDKQAAKIEFCIMLVLSLFYPTRLWIWIVF
jgi:hypothetical protein